MRLGAAALILSFAAFAQAPPPSVDEALRARVNEFYGYHVTGDFEKAWPMVADDTKKEYFTAQKLKYEAFKIDSIKYTDNFTKAVVTLTVTERRRMGPQMPELSMVHPSTVTWKIENEKWCWYNDHSTNWILPMGPSDPSKTTEATRSGTQTQGTQNPGGVTPEKLQTLAASILGQSALDKTELTLPLNKESSEEVVFHNGQGGSVKLALMPANLPPGMSAALDKTDIEANGNAKLKVAYKPVRQRESAAVPADVTLNLVMEPFSRMFPVRVRFAASQ